ncbi:cohesin domain-containing protein [Clostridium sp. FP1]|uniref:cohesin domain-containing protein n=1 Tax=Clostridium sp. FP1 TaxID=2724076 RepID=UPI001CCCBE5F|nr:cohesin domain-containing protein [Clostridium sp. FP1]MBZ9633087.1 cohesin domain-containing protein [Clostridium sp. FP1]
MKRFYQKCISKMAIVFLIALVFGVLSCGSVYADTVGRQLLQPENGWKRYSYADENLNFSGYGSISTDSGTGMYQYRSPNANKAKIKFNFVGDKIRIIGGGVHKYFPTNISIDGVVEAIYRPTSSYNGLGVVYEKSNLDSKEHCVEIISDYSSTEAYFPFYGVDILNDGKLKQYNEGVISKVVVNIEPEKNKIKKNETVTANLVIDNITNIAAEDIRIKYDSEKLQFIDFKEVDGIKLVKNDAKVGELRFILASKGKNNIADAKKILLKLNFKGIKAGEALVDVVKGRVSDGIEMEKDLTDAECGQATIVIEDSLMKDVNNSGEYTLLDLAIDGRHLGEAPTTLPQYNTDVIVNSAIDDADLLEIGNQMLLNPNYKF